MVKEGGALTRVVVKVSSVPFWMATMYVVRKEMCADKFVVQALSREINFASEENVAIKKRVAMVSAVDRERTALGGCVFVSQAANVAKIAARTMNIASKEFAKNVLVGRAA